MYAMSVFYDIYVIICLCVCFEKLVWGMSHIMCNMLLYRVVAALMDSIRNKWVKLGDKDGYKRKNSKAGDPGMIYRMQVRGKAGTGKTYHARYLKYDFMY